MITASTYQQCPNWAFCMYLEVSVSKLQLIQKTAAGFFFNVELLTLASKDLQISSFILFLHNPKF